MKNVLRVAAGLALTMSLAGGSVTNAESVQNEIPLFKMYDTEEGTYLLDPAAETENVIFVDKEEAIEWEVYEIHHGTKVTGLFDEEGWELEGIKK